jgi:hypothetical protein
MTESWKLRHFKAGAGRGGMRQLERGALVFALIPHIFAKDETKLLSRYFHWPFAKQMIRLLAFPGPDHVGLKVFRERRLDHHQASGAFWQPFV